MSSSTGSPRSTTKAPASRSRRWRRPRSPSRRGEFVALLGPSRLRQEHAADDDRRPRARRAAAHAVAGRAAHRAARARPASCSRIRRCCRGRARSTTCCSPSGGRSRHRAAPIRATVARAASCSIMVGLQGFHHHKPAPALRRHAPARRHLPRPGLRARLLLMDEPFSALDAITRDEMNLVLMKMWEEHHRTALFVTHSHPRGRLSRPTAFWCMSRRPAASSRTSASRSPGRAAWRSARRSSSTRSAATCAARSSTCRIDGTSSPSTACAR